MKRVVTAIYQQDDVTSLPFMGGYVTWSGCLLFGFPLPVSSRFRHAQDGLNLQAEITHRPALARFVILINQLQLIQPVFVIFS